MDNLWILTWLETFQILSNIVDNMHNFTIFYNAVCCKTAHSLVLMSHCWHNLHGSGPVYRLLNQSFTRRRWHFTQATHRRRWGWGGDQSAQMKVVQGDYLASNRVLAPTLRLKPFSITGISADVAPASPDPLELPASCPFVFAGSLPLC